MNSLTLGIANADIGKANINIAEHRYLHELPARNRFVESLPGETPDLPHVPKNVADVCYSRVSLTPVRAPRLIGWSAEAGKLIGVKRPENANNSSLDILAGNMVPNGTTPYAARYGGYQFGCWAGQLGDGRAISIGEYDSDPASTEEAYGNHSLLKLPSEIKSPLPKFWELQLKGPGLTPYSRRGDGRAVLRSSLREFLCSEAMYHLGIPTTRALSLVETGEDVIRDMFYDGNAKAEKGAIVCRMAPSFLRFGNFEIHAATGETQILKKLADYCINSFFPYLITPRKVIDSEIYAAFFNDVCNRTAYLMAKWMGVGFVHGVMNTDNMSILGLTIDYGPYGWLEGYDPEWTPNTTDAATKRYSYGSQPQIALWNLARLGEALYPLVESEELLETGLMSFQNSFKKYYYSLMANKIGLRSLETEKDIETFDNLLLHLQESEVDMTIFFRSLSTIDQDSSPEYTYETLSHAYYDNNYFQGIGKESLWSWIKDYQTCLKEHYPNTDKEDRQEKMSNANPYFVLRNYIATSAIEKAESGDLSEIETLLEIIKSPYNENDTFKSYVKPRPEWARSKAGCSMLSCSS